MSTDTKNIRNHLKETPFTVPEGYFSEFSARMMKQLPAYPEQPRPAADRTFWQKIIPYVSLAAMFIGIWCMMKVFHVVSQPDYSLDNPPEAVVVAMNDPETYSYFSGEFIEQPQVGTMTDDELEQEVEEMCPDMDQLEQELGITLEPRYDNIVIN